MLRRLPPYQRYLARMFDSAACHAAESAFFASRKRALFAHLSALGDDPAVLDLGAGAGVNARYLPPNVKRITAVEPNQEMVRAEVPMMMSSMTMTQRAGFCALRHDAADACAR